MQGRKEGYALKIQVTLSTYFTGLQWALHGVSQKGVDNSNAASKFMEAHLCPITLRFMTFLAQMFYFLKVIEFWGNLLIIMTEY